MTLVAASNFIIGMAITLAVVGGLTLFWIARQDGSPKGRILGILIMVAATIVATYTNGRCTRLIVTTRFAAIFNCAAVSVSSARQLWAESRLATICKSFISL
jgi:hypothetical protein